MANRDPETIKREIDEARDRLALTVDSLAERANPQRLAEDVRSVVVGFIKKPAVTASLAGVGAIVAIVIVRRIKRR
ncbi:DUF3618 domain-containing protein [Mycolicibacterium goodii]|uniref:DUF3618 domain-containing protein n=1 Tax=Mycolicibacterium goodii TaxID=134601 RepID=A0ABS6HFH1_MYCGD|nr:DUF3618 domain-containing protein [Mycolicibacterium goodii]OKH75855.1 hypothetical protein EB74_14205 [Mycobacterium sp. SWH-M5]MBU8810531.1 DUF3618 domain-containing protein [Mycolicibacterium goodii]MBU8814904.1 DUF3618 domain-containing protein [Mycolicibacterium goodii]MBU8821416.1 DUF3618 domain-containing protein [Mycolicibacterium goodii]MBU8831475.1 DUF3618 domain-containing protein [Mycolicibacterium goodii]